MNTMQQFHAWLESACHTFDQPAQDALVRLTQVTAAQLRAFENDMSWESWGAAEHPSAAAPGA
jgi:hypothetical protein